MLKKLLKTHSFLLVLSLALIVVSSCSKNDDPAPQLSSKDIPLMYNSAQVGTVLISEKANGNASLKITLNSSAVVPGASPAASIVSVINNSEAGLYASLTSFSAGGNISTTDPVLEATPPNTPIPYASLVAKTGYKIKVIINATIQYTATL